MTWRLVIVFVAGPDEIAARRHDAVFDPVAVSIDLGAIAAVEIREGLHCGGIHILGVRPKDMVRGTASPATSSTKTLDVV